MRRFEQITFVNYQPISHTDNLQIFIAKIYNSNLQNLQFLFRSNNLRKISKKMITDVHRAQQTM